MEALAASAAVFAALAALASASARASASACSLTRRMCGLSSRARASIASTSEFGSNRACPATAELDAARDAENCFASVNALSELSALTSAPARATASTFSLALRMRGLSSRARVSISSTLEFESRRGGAAIVELDADAAGPVLVEFCAAVVVAAFSAIVPPRSIERLLQRLGNVEDCFGNAQLNRRIMVKVDELFHFQRII
jgi:hypothetical protein